jgi:hypothetical protein
MNRRFFGKIEVAFDAIYLLTALAVGVRALFEAKLLLAAMALVLALGDAFHLVPRMRAALGCGGLEVALGFGKLAASVTMTVFYVLLWHWGAPRSSFPPIWTTAVYMLAAFRVGLSMFPENRWYDDEPPVRWAVARNLPFLLEGLAVAALYYAIAPAVPGVKWVWLAVLLSFAFYLPVALFAHKNRRFGMLMLPKTVMYLWILFQIAGIPG